MGSRKRSRIQEDFLEVASPGLEAGRRKAVQEEKAIRTKMQRRDQGPAQSGDEDWVLMGLLAKHTAGRPA